MTTTTKHRQLITLFPRYLSSRRAGWKGLQALLHASGLDRPSLVLLIAMHQETDPGAALSRDELMDRLFDPYSTIDSISDDLPALVEQGYLASTDEGAHRVTSRGQALVEQIEQGARAYLATIQTLPPPELERLATTLEELAAREWRAAEPSIKAHQARAHRLLPVERDASAMVRLEVAIFALWMARDDAHMASWRAEGFSGPHLDLLSMLVKGGGTWTLAELTTSFEHTQRRQDIAQGIARLAGDGYVRVEGERVEATEAGRQIRARIEAETDRLYFTPWPPLPANDLDWLYTSLEQVCTVCEAMRAKS